MECINSLCRSLQLHEIQMFMPDNLEAILYIYLSARIQVQWNSVAN
jgi:hypothetical protein